MNFLTILQSLTESGIVAANAFQLDQRTMESFGSFLVLVLAWSMVRPNMIRDYDNRALPYNPTARIAFSVACAFAYLTLAFTYLTFIGVAERVTSMVPHAGQFIEAFKGQPAMLAVVTLGGMLQFSVFRDIERSSAIWLHSRRHISDDLEKLRRHLEAGPFVPSVEERQKNRDSAKKHGIYVTDESIDVVGLVTFNKWRKASTLLRLVQEWNAAEDTRVLSPDDMKQLGDLQTSHDRKTELAMTIIKMVDEVQVHQGGETEKALGAMLKVLTDTPHIDRDSVAAAEARAKIILSGLTASEEFAKKPLRLTGEQLRNRLGQIEKYFDVEYQILLEQVSTLAARSVLIAGDKATDRLEQLSAAGVGGLGRIQKSNFNFILWMFLVISLGGFLVMYLGYSRNMAPGMAEGLARFAFAMAIASLIGAIVGSRRRHAQAKDTPWGKYVTGGIFAGLAFIGISVLSNWIKTTLGVAPPPGQPPFSVYRMLPWALLPFLTTVAIARLARIPHWPQVKGIDTFRWLYVRSADGLCVSLALLVAFSTAIALHPLLDIELSANLKKSMEGIWLPIPINWTVQALGFLIGFTVVRDVRWAAHSTIIAADKPAGESDAAVEPESARIESIALVRSEAA